MQHDITHCRKEECPSKDKCYRYKAYIEAQERKMEYISVFKPDNIELIDGKCTLFWNMEDYYNK